MRNLLVSLILLGGASASGQNVLLNETFESTGGTAPPLGWSWTGSAPVYVPGTSGGFGISKESYDLSAPPPPTNYSAPLFHPLPYDPSWLYRITGHMYVYGPGAATAAAGAILCWMDLTTGTYVTSGNNITSFSQFPNWEFKVGMYGTVPPNWLGPNAQFGIMLVCGVGTGNSYAAFDDITVNYTLPWVGVQPRIWLDGAYEQGANLMRDDLRTAGLIPSTEPYSAIYGGPGGETVAPSVLSVTGNNAIVDWVRLELRTSPTGPTVASAHGLLQRDGDVVSVDGFSALRLNTTAGLYHVVVRHRNHLAVMTASALSMALFNTWTIDFRSPTTTCYTRPAPNTDLPRRAVGSTRTLWSGNVIADDRVKYTGPSNDRDAVLQAIGGVTPTATLSGQYRLEDVNLDGVVKYTGAANDRDVVLSTIGGTTPTAVRLEQVP
jgi:hypothetical protein